VDMLTLFKKLIIKIHVNAKGENDLISFFWAFSMWKQPLWNNFDIMHGTQSPLYFFFSFINHKSYKFAMVYNDVNDM
jgi:hypothetical protein